MIGGVGPDGTVYDEISYRKELELLRDGAITVEIPDDINGGTETIELEVEYQGSDADLLGLQQLSRLPDSFTALHPCKDCWFTTGCDCAHAIEDPLHKTPCEIEGCRGCGARTLEEQQADLHRIDNTYFSSKAKREAACREAGVSATKTTSVIEQIPGAHPQEDLLYDIMHIFFCGITGRELYNMACKMVKAGYTTWADIDAMRKRVVAQSGCKLAALVLPKTDNKKKKSLAFVMNGATCMYWTVNRCLPPAVPTRPHHQSLALTLAHPVSAVSTCSSRC